jgi:hypothetical protein
MPHAVVIVGDEHGDAPGRNMSERLGPGEQRVVGAQPGVSTPLCRKGRARRNQTVDQRPDVTGKYLTRQFAGSKDVVDDSGVKVFETLRCHGTAA